MINRDGNFTGNDLAQNQLISNKQFQNGSFEKCNLSDLKFINCEFEDCIFTNCNFSASQLAHNKGYNSGKFIRCIFNKSNFQKTSFNFPIIDNCEFNNCRLKETNFGGSRLSNTKFVGELDACFFDGYSIYANSGSFFSFSRFDPLTVPNKMVNVDFSQAKLVGVSFANKIDLSQCVFPVGEDYVYIPHVKETMEKVLEYINSKWIGGDEKEAGLFLVNNLYYNKRMKEQSNAFFDAFIPREKDNRDGGNVGMKVFNLIKLYA